MLFAAGKPLSSVAAGPRKESEIHRTVPNNLIVIMDNCLPDLSERKGNLSSKQAYLGSRVP